MGRKVTELVICFIISRISVWTSFSVFGLRFAAGGGGGGASLRVGVREAVMRWSARLLREDGKREVEAFERTRLVCCLLLLDWLALPSPSLRQTATSRASPSNPC